MAEEKKELINDVFEHWIAGMVDTSKNYVKAWDVVNEPLDDANPYELKTGVGKTVNEDEFYWQDYLGKDYAVKAFKLARQHGNPTDIFFINDYNLEYSLDKCKGLIDYVKYIESKGAKVDGIGTQMHISTTSDKGKTEEMFRLLAATGKLIKVSELDIGIDGKKTAQATDDDYKLQADLYTYVIDTYFEITPVDQQYGITIWSPLDSPNNSSCGSIRQDLRLKDRTWTCFGCNSLHDRDLNASVNIKKQGLKILAVLGTNPDVKQKRREASPPGESMNSETHLIATGVGG